MVTHPKICHQAWYEGEQVIMHTPFLAEALAQVVCPEKKPDVITLSCCPVCPDVFLFLSHLHTLLFF